MLKTRTGQGASKTIHPVNSRSHSKCASKPNRRRRAQPKPNSYIDRPFLGREVAYQKLKNRLISRGLPKNVFDDLLEHTLTMNYKRKSYIFSRGAPTDMLFWVSGGLVDILCPAPDGTQRLTSILGPGDFFGLVESNDDEGKAGQALQARARTNVEIRLLVRNEVGKAFSQLDPSLLVHILGEVVAECSRMTLHYMQFMGMTFRDRLAIVLAEYAEKFGVKESRGVLLLSEFSHSDFADLIGCSRPMASKTIAELISDGRLARTGSHYIVKDSVSLNGKASGLQAAADHYR